jgi:hypothetical protein
LLYDFEVQLKQLRGLGYGPGDVADTADALARRRREEDSLLSLWDPTRSPKAARRQFWLFFAFFMLNAGWLVIHPELSWHEYAQTLVFGLVSLAQLGALKVSQRRPETRVSLIGRFWRSRLVRWYWKRIGGGTEEPLGALSQRPTEIRLGLTVDDLFASLPLDARRELRELLPLVRRLEARAQALRKRIAGEDRESGTEQHLEQVVGALEVIRIDLMRLQAGSGTLKGITADLAAAQEVGERVDRLLLGHAEVKDLLAGH